MSIYSKSTIKPAASDTHFVRLVIHDVANSGRYTLQARSNQFVFEKCPVVNRHILDIPLSVWQGGAQSAISSAAWRDNNCIAEQIRRSNASVSMYVLPYDRTAIVFAENDNVPSDRAEALLTALQNLFQIYGAPDEITKLCEMAESGAASSELKTYAESVRSQFSEPTADAEPEQSVSDEKPKRKKAKAVSVEDPDDLA